MNRKEKQARLKQLQKAIRALAMKAQNGNLSERERIQLVAMDKEAQRLDVTIQGEFDMALFAYTYFSDQFNPDNAAGNIIVNQSDDEPHEKLEELAPIHRDMYDICDDMTRGKSKRYVIACPRSHAKSSIISTIKNIHSLCYNTNGIGEYLLIISETDTLAKRIVASIANQLKYNERLREDFGELLYVQSNRNERDNEDAFITTKRQLVEASSAGKSLRGKTFNNTRPSSLTLDDISSLNNEGTEEQREKLIHWMNSTVEPIPSKHGIITFVGTKVTSTGVLAHLLQRRDYKKLFHSAIVNDSDAPDLWNDYIHMYRSDATDADLDAFYEANKADMESGVEIAWPRAWTYRALMQKKADIGARAFASEFLNESFASDEQHFSPGEYAYGRRVFDGQHRLDAIEYEGKYYYLRDMTKTATWDPALAESKRSALNAYVTIGKHDATGLVFVLDVYAAREVPSIFMMEILTRVAEFKPQKVICEGIGAYRSYSEQLQDLLRVNGFYNTRVETIKSHGTKSKATRIEALEVPLASKSIVLNLEHKELYRELQEYPNGVIDVLDALEMCFTHARKRRLQLMEKPTWL